MADVPGWVLPALAQVGNACPFTDYPATYNPVPSPTNRTSTSGRSTVRLRRRISSSRRSITDIPTWIRATFRLKVTGLVNKSLSLSLDDLKKLRNVETGGGLRVLRESVPAGWRAWRATRVDRRAAEDVLDQAGVKAEAREFVFFGADHGTEEVEFRTSKYTVRTAIRPEPDPRARAGRGAVPGLGAERRTADQTSGLPAPVDRARLVRGRQREMARADSRPGRGYLGRFQARWFRTLRGEMIDGEMKWKETAVTHMRLKSVIARVTTDGTRYKVQGSRLTTAHR